MFTLYRKVKAYYDGLTDIGQLGFSMFVGTGLPIFVIIMIFVVKASIEKLIS